MVVVVAAAAAEEGGRRRRRRGSHKNADFGISISSVERREAGASLSVVNRRPGSGHAASWQHIIELVAVAACCCCCCTREKERKKYKRDAMYCSSSSPLLSSPLCWRLRIVVTQVDLTVSCWSGWSVCVCVRERNETKKGVPFAPNRPTAAERIRNP